MGERCNNGIYVELRRAPAQQQGFTLLELSIVLVIIGLVVGGILLAKDLIEQAAVVGQVAQITKYNAATVTFRAKFDAFPGDMDSVTASRNGFAARGTDCSGNPCAGEGDGNGLIEGYISGRSPPNGPYEMIGETVMFWSDLTYANGMNLNMIEGSFNVASSSSSQGGCAIPGACLGYTNLSLSQLLPVAKLGKGNYVYVWSEFGTNYFAVSAVGSIFSGGLLQIGTGTNNPDGTFTGLSMTPGQAYAIDLKMDDGYPLTGSVIAVAVDWGSRYINARACMNMQVQFSSPAMTTQCINAGASAPAADTCMDNGNVSGAQFHYTLNQNSGNNPACALSFQFQ